MSDSRRAFLIAAGLVTSGSVSLYLASALDQSWLYVVGGLLLFLPALALTLIVGQILLFLVVFYGLHFLSSAPGRFERWLEGSSSGSDGTARRRAGDPVPVEQCYRMFVARREPVADPSELCRPVTRLVRAIQRAGGRASALYGDSAFGVARVVSSWDNRLPTFLAGSKVRWNHGREPSDPTHERIFFTRFNGTHAVYLRIAFVVDDPKATCPGLVAELRLTPVAAGVGSEQHGARLERLFTALVEALGADFGHLELPGQPDALDWPTAPGVGWLTLVPGACPEVAARFPSCNVKPCGRGALVFAMPPAPTET